MYEYLSLYNINVHKSMLYPCNAISVHIKQCIHTTTYKNQYKVFTQGRHAAKRKINQRTIIFDLMKMNANSLSKTRQQTVRLLPFAPEFLSKSQK